MCIVKQIPELSKSCWMLFGQNIKDKITFQLEFQAHQETTMVNYLMNMADTDTDETLTLTQTRLILVKESPETSHIGSLWALEGIEMYRKKFCTASALNNSLHQDVIMLCMSAQIEEFDRQATNTSHHYLSHCMQTRSKAKH